MDQLNLCQKLTIKEELFHQPIHDTDDWIKPFGCNHVVLGFSPDNKLDETNIEKCLSAICVMCGKSIHDDKQKAVVENIDDFSFQNVNTNKISSNSSSRLMGHDENAKTDVFHNPRTMSSAATIAPSSIKACTIHNHKKIRYFCEDHQEICCSVCVNVLHKCCKRVMFIKDEIVSGWDSRVSEETLNAMVAVRKSFCHIINFNKQTKAILGEQVGNFLIKRKELRSRIIELLDDFERTSDTMIKKYLKMTEDGVNAAIQMCECAIKDVDFSKELLTHAMQANSVKDSFIATHKIIRQKEKYGVTLSQAVQASKDVTLTLQPEKNIINIEELTKLATVYFKAKPALFPESVITAVSKIPKRDLRLPKTVEDAFTRSESVEPPLVNPLSQSGEFNVRLTDDKMTCENVGATFLSDGRAAIVDINNRKLKVFDLKFSRATAISLTSGPRGVAVISPQEVAITLPDESKIQIVSVGKTLRARRSILTSIPCYGISCLNQELYVLCDDGFAINAIQVLDFSGNVLKNIEMKKSGALKNPWDLSLSCDGRLICVSDRRRVVGLDVNGTVLFQYTDRKLENPHGLTVDDLGRFYVCGTSSNNVHRMSADGLSTEVVLTEQDVAAPEAVCFSFGMRLLLLTFVGSDQIRIYRVLK